MHPLSSALIFVLLVVVRRVRGGSLKLASEFEFALSPDLRVQLDGIRYVISSIGAGIVKPPLWKYLIILKEYLILPLNSTIILEVVCVV